MATITAIRNGINTNVKTIPGLQTYPRLPGKIDPPCALVIPADPFITRESMGLGMVRLKFVVTVLAASTEPVQAQRFLEEYLDTSGAKSVWTAIESDVTLGGTVSDCKVDQVSAPKMIVWNDTTYWGAELALNILAVG